jgi:formiminotetrahydrofolate cyclodeaminase
MDTTTLWGASLGAFRDETASAKPTPGGGSVACVAGALGASLLVMAAEITGKSSPAAELDAWLRETRALIASLTEHADRDVAVFEGYMRALGLPNATEEDRASRKEALRAAALEATAAPLAAAIDMARALELGVGLAKLVKKSVLSDVLAGADLLDGSIRASLRNVDVNLGALGDHPAREAAARQRDAVLERAARAYAAVTRGAARAG